MIRVIIADDSATARHLLRTLLEQDGDIRVIAEAHDGEEAIDLVAQLRPDLVVMDVHMPRADGLAATKEIMTRAPTPIVIVSAVTQRDVDLSLSATQAGALLALPKPDSPASPRFVEQAAELRSMVRAMAQVKVVRRWGRSAPPARPAPRRRRDGVPLVAVAASTGGPAALRRLLGELPRVFPAPILVVQHIARDFTAGFVEWLGGTSQLPVRLAQHGAVLEAGVAYVAPDDAHLGVTRERRVLISSAPPVAGFRPSASFLFESAGRVAGTDLIAVVLTGMGTDGADGLVSAHAAGAYVIAQDETSSVVYGMAQETVRRGVADAILPLDQIAPRLVELIAENAHVE